MKIVGLIPYWLDYKVNAAEHRNLKKLGGRYLLNYTLSLLSKSPSLTSTYVFASSESVLRYIDPHQNYQFLRRPQSLDSLQSSIEDIIDAFLAKIDADIVVLLHPNSPFLRTETLQACVDAVVSGVFDSAFTALILKKLAWFKGLPLNYAMDRPTPSLASIQPVVVEHSSLYVFDVAMYRKTRKRVGSNPFIKAVDHFEGHEIVEPEDFAIAELIVNAGMYSET
jgi:CMP-N-acetylneuraminic acid synthetase